MKYSILALCLLSSQAHSLTTECDDGYVYKLFQQTVIQAMDQSGNPQLCGERLEAKVAANKLYVELMHKHQLEMLRIINRPFPSYLGEKE